MKYIENGTIVTPKGFHVAGMHAGLKRKRKDLGIIYSENKANAAAVYTLNQIQAAPITVTKETITKEETIQAVIVNSGNANACTGDKGIEDAKLMQKVTAESLQISKQHVAVASTGVIGEYLPMEQIIQNIPKLEVSNHEKCAEDFNEAILTTDTFTKSTCYEVTIDNKPITIAGSAKGSGMIEPNMGTMLSFITTDANIPSQLLDKALKLAVNKTFNCVTVDGDTSTNDMVLVLANGLQNNKLIEENSADWEVFLQGLSKVCEDLAKMIAKDGEGATKLIEVEVKGAKETDDAMQIAKSIVGSSLVKTMIYGNDANWGRVIAAIGYSGIRINPDTIDMYIGNIPLLKNSEPVAFSETEASSYLQNDTIQISVNIHDGSAVGKAWGCDLTYDYVKINASYRT